jgi:hypothetical protein
MLGSRGTGGPIGTYKAARWPKTETAVATRCNDGPARLLGASSRGRQKCPQFSRSHWSTVTPGVAAGTGLALRGDRSCAFGGVSGDRNGVVSKWSCVAVAKMPESDCAVGIVALYRAPLRRCQSRRSSVEGHDVSGSPSAPDAGTSGPSRKHVARSSKPRKPAGYWTQFRRW